MKSKKTKTMNRIETNKTGKKLRKTLMKSSVEEKVRHKIGDKVGDGGMSIKNEIIVVDKIINKSIFDEMSNIVNSNISVFVDKFGDLDYVRDVLKNLNLRVQYFTLEMAMLLYLVLENRWYNVWGYKTLEDYATKELNFTPRKAEMLARIYEYYGIELGQTPDIGRYFSNFGWSKMYMLIGVVNQSNFDYWKQEITKPLLDLKRVIVLYKLKNSSDKYFDGVGNNVNIGGDTSGNVNNDSNDNNDSVDKANSDKNLDTAGSGSNDFRDSGYGIMSEKLALVGDGSDKRVVSYKRLFFDVTEEQLGIIDKALQVAIEGTASEKFANRGYILSLICLSYLSEFVSNGKVDLKILLKKLESMLNIRLIAVQDYAIIYGDDFVEEVVLK